MTVGSSRPSLASSMTPIDSKRSSVETDTRTPWEVLVRLCPDLPTRWTRLLTWRGDIYWTTRSTDPISMPNSRVLVQTSPLIWRALNASSARTRSSFGSDPWWTIMFWPIKLNFEPNISALTRLLTKIRVESCASTRSDTSASRAAASGAVYRRRASSWSSSPGVGYSILYLVSLLRGIWTILTGSEPPRNREISSGFPTVAERPIRWKPSCRTSFSLSSPTVSWTPRRFPASSWTSSTTTALTCRRCCLILFPGRTAWSVSGVVMRRSGGLPAILLRSAAGVSPCLTSTAKPSFTDQICRRLSRSRFSALRGVM